MTMLTCHSEEQLWVDKALHLCLMYDQKRVFLCVLILGFLVWSILYSFLIKSTFPVPVRLQRTPKNTSIEVYFYNKPSDFSLNVFSKCEYACHMVEKKNYSDSYAVVFHAPTLYMDPIPKSNGQIWIFYALEPPYRYPEIWKLKRWNLMFNWTIGYRRDSDILNTYGRFTKTKTEINRTQILIKWKKKKYTAAWFVSNCNDDAKRKHYTNKLKRLIYIDTFGACGKLKCSKPNDGECQNKLDAQYKFYLAFESAFCRDYITEKSLRLYYDYRDVIPVVRGTNEHKLLLPPHSYISTASFGSINKLAGTINMVSNNASKAMQYFKWRNNFSASSMLQDPFCELCKKLHDPMKYQRIYEDINDWLRGGHNNKICNPVNDFR